MVDILCDANDSVQLIELKMRHGEGLDNRNSKRAVKADYVSSIVTALLDGRCRKKARVDQRGSGG